MKVCRTCQKELPLDHFWKRKRNKDGLEAHCSECLKAKHQQWVEANRPVAQDSWRRASKKHYSTEGGRARHLAKYNLTIEEFNALVKAQGGRCAICQEQKKLCVDHDHQTGQVRGLLCTGCNTGLGKLGDSINNLNKAIEYLARVQVNGNLS